MADIESNAHNGKGKEVVKNDNNEIDNNEE